MRCQLHLYLSALFFHMTIDHTPSQVQCGNEFLFEDHYLVKKTNKAKTMDYVHEVSLHDENDSVAAALGSSTHSVLDNDPNLRERFGYFSRGEVEAYLERRALERMGDTIEAGGMTDLQSRESSHTNEKISAFVANHEGENPILQIEHEIFTVQEYANASYKEKLNKTQGSFQKMQK